MKVLFVNHTGLVSGAEHSLLTLIDALPPEVVGGLACPPGELADAATAHGIEVLPIRGTAGSLRLHPLHTPLALGELALSATQVGQLATRIGADVVHANSIRVRRTGLVTHIRDCLPNSMATRIIRRRVAAQASEVVAISEYAAERFRGGLGAATGVSLQVIDDPIDLERFAPRADLVAPAGGPLLIVGQITPWKGHDTAIRALAGIHDAHPDLRLQIVGAVKFAGPATRFDNQAYLDSLRALIDELGLGAAVEFVGERSDIPEIMASATAVLVPSVEEPFGRTVAEAMAVGTPVVATTIGGPAEVVEDGVTGLLADPHDPAAWSRAIARIVADPASAREMAARAGEVARRRFAPQRHAAAMMDAFESAAGARRGAPD